MRTEKNIVVAGGTAAIGSAAVPHISPAKRSSWTVATLLVNATAPPKPSSLFLQT
jgi:hypothetical protein